MRMSWSREPRASGVGAAWLSPQGGAREVAVACCSDGYMKYNIIYAQYNIRRMSINIIYAVYYIQKSNIIPTLVRTLVYS